MIFRSIASIIYNDMAESIHKYIFKVPKGDEGSQAQGRKMEDRRRKFFFYFRRAFWYFKIRIC